MSEEDFGPTGFTFKMPANLAGYVGDLTLTAETGRDLLRMVKALAATGIEQPSQMPAAAAPVAQDGPGLVCTYHGAMKPSKYGGWHCTAKMGDGSYSAEKVK